MNKTSVAAVATLLGIGLAACDTPTDPGADPLGAATASVAPQGAVAWTDLTPGSVQFAANSSAAKVEHISGQGVVSVTASPSGIQASRSEDYENANDPFIGVCAGPINHLTNDGCYSPEEIVEGISMDNLDSGFDPLGSVVAVGPIFGPPSTTVGPNFFVDSTVLDFGYGGGANVLFSVYAPFGQCWLRLFVYDANGLIGLFAIQTGSGSGAARYQVTAFGTTMTRFELVSSDNCAELIDDVVLSD